LWNPGFLRILDDEMRYILYILIFLQISSAFSQDTAMLAQKRRLILYTMNKARKACGLDTVVMSPALSKGCNLHARYLAINKDSPKTQGLSAHKEYPELKGYTKEGELAGQRSVIEYGYTGEIADWIPTFYHRVDILDPALINVGIGINIKDDYVVSLINTHSGKRKESKISVIFYPNAAQKNIPLKMENEHPNPTPLPESGAAGFPITITFTKYQSIKDVKFKLTDGAGKPVDCFLSTPETPACDFTQMNTVCAIPKKPLKPNTGYTVNFTCKLDSTIFKKTYSFKTGSK
jgi:hypothetical protein